ncbi:hypothetical protein [Agrobacterium larrymoorei]|uniref:Uncharacterized protein n=1 Tax=Agrobacterium larrymoorei TaxID=160699 RepID=A0AAF0HAI3_9HYPH|nr:hypothetical protein [Agrobacterium larrymoorei]WHA42242.1 hypothetical protein CFBP5477_006375 [Agrobacterium larrymoorei]
MAYDWSGGRTKRFRRLKIGAAISVILLAAFIVQFVFSTSS